MTDSEWKEVDAAVRSAAATPYQARLLSGDEPWSRAGAYKRKSADLLQQISSALPDRVTAKTMIVFNAATRRMERRLVISVSGTDHDWLYRTKLVRTEGRGGGPVRMAAVP